MRRERVEVAEISSPGEWWVPEQVWWEVLGLGPIECGQPLKVEKDKRMDFFFFLEHPEDLQNLK